MTETVKATPKRQKTELLSDAPIMLKSTVIAGDSNHEKIGVIKLYDDVPLPEKATSYAACADIRAYLKTDNADVKGFFSNNHSFNRPIQNNRIVIDPKERVMIPTGLILDIPQGYRVDFYPRSGLSLKFGVNLINCIGIVDSDYTDECFVLLHNTSDQRFIIEDGERIAQIALVKVEDFVFQPINMTKEELKVFKASNRTGGFGSTGSK